MKYCLERKKLTYKIFKKESDFLLLPCSFESEFSHFTKP